MKTTIQARIDYLIAEHGSLRAVARAIGVDVGYLSRLRSGEKARPEEDTLERLGLQRVVSYELTDARAAQKGGAQ